MNSTTKVLTRRIALYRMRVIDKKKSFYEKQRRRRSRKTPYPGHIGRKTFSLGAITGLFSIRSSDLRGDLLVSRERKFARWGKGTSSVAFYEKSHLSPRNVRFSRNAHERTEKSSRALRFGVDGQSEARMRYFLSVRIAARIPKLSALGDVDVCHDDGSTIPRSRSADLCFLSLLGSCSFRSDRTRGLMRTSSSM